MRKDLVIEIISSLLIILFAYTGISKLLNYNDFVIAIHKSELLKKVPAWIAWMVPASEIIISLMLALPKWRKQGLRCAALLMLLFTCYVAFVLSFSKNLPCTCGGIMKEMNWQQHLLFNIAFLAISVIGIWMYRHTAQLSSKARVVIST